jgi:hypothetical protein
MAVFTHKFEIVFDGVSLIGDVEFNGDGKVSYSFEGDPILSMDNAKLLNELFSILQHFYYENEGLKKVLIKEKI